jgi:tetratricopeptide (TPR) repeat protein
MFDAAGQHDAANAIYDAVPANSPMKPTAVLRVAANLDATGDRTEAIRRLGNIVTLNPDNLDALSTLGDLLRSDGQYLKAADAYTKAIKLSGGDLPADWRYYYVRGIAYERGNEWPKAEADFLKSLDLNPDQPQVLNYLGYSWVDKGMNLDKAMEMIQKAVAASPNDGYIVDSLGWAYYKMGQYDQAVNTLEKAVQLASTDPEINDHLPAARPRRASSGTSPPASTRKATSRSASSPSSPTGSTPWPRTRAGRTRWNRSSRPPPPRSTWPCTSPAGGPMATMSSIRSSPSPISATS